MRLGSILLIALLFAEWTDNVLAEVLPADTFPVITPPTLQPAVLLTFKYRQDLLDRTDGASFDLLFADDRCNSNPPVRLDPAWDLFLPCRSDPARLTVPLRL